MAAVLVDFSYIKTRASQDLRSVSALFEDAAKEVDAGDIRAFDAILAKLPEFHEMLALRAAYLEEKRGETIEVFEESTP